MKRLVSVITVLILATSMVACGVSNEEKNEVKTETMSENYGDAVIVAQNEFNSVFSQFDGLEIAETSTMMKTNNNSLVVQFSYLSDNGSGVYGFEITRDDYGNYEIVRQGKDITIDNLVKEESQNKPKFGMGETDMGKSAGGVSIIGGAYGPTSIFIAGKGGMMKLTTRIRNYFDKTIFYRVNGGCF